jgi:hypothetical protein
MTDQTSTGPEGADPEFAPDGLGTGGFGDEGLGTDLGSDDASDDRPGDAANRTDEATPGGTRGDADVANHGDDPGAGRQGPMVSDAAIDWSALEGGSAPAGIPTDPEPTDGDAPAP